MYLRFTPVFLLEQLHRVNAIIFLLNLAPSRQDLTGSCVGNELAVHAACLGMSLGALQGCRKQECPSVVQRIKWIQQICVAFEFQDVLSVSRKHCLFRVVITCKIVEILIC